MSILETKMSPSSSGKISYVDLEFHEQLLRIMGPNLITPYFEIFA